jgi:hypothetical protein
MLNNENGSLISLPTTRNLGNKDYKKVKSEIMECKSRYI